MDPAKIITRKGKKTTKTQTQSLLGKWKTKTKALEQGLEREC